MLREVEQKKQQKSQHPEGSFGYIYPSPSCTPVLLAIVAVVFKFGLEVKGFEVDAYPDPSEALSNFKANHYYTIVSDVRLPKMNSFELCKQLL